MAPRAWQSPLFLAGLLVWGLCIAVWAVVWAASRTKALAMAATFGAFFVAGKIAAIPMGLAFHLHPVLVGFIVLVPDIGAVLLAYPLTHGGIRILGRWSGFIRRLHRNAVRASERREGFVAKYGSLGVFVLALLPVGFYSPLVVSAIGQLMGLSTWRVIVPVVAGMTVMTAVWVGAMGAGFYAAEKIDPRLPFVLSLGLLLLAVGVEVVRRLRRGKEPEDDAADEASPVTDVGKTQ